MAGGTGEKTIDLLSFENQVSPSGWGFGDSDTGSRFFLGEAGGHGFDVCNDGFLFLE
jgi:hypothetical protein